MTLDQRLANLANSYFKYLAAKTGRGVTRHDLDTKHVYSARSIIIVHRLVYQNVAI